MKKLLFTFIFLSIFIPNINAETLTSKSLIGYNYVIKNTNTNDVQKNYTSMFYMNDEIVYCIDPGAEITTHSYDKTSSFDITKINKEKIDEIEKIGYFGYEYPGHKTIKYYLAAQEYIWETVNDKLEVYFKDDNSNKIDLTTEKTNIKNLIKNYDIKPSFDNKTYDALLEENILLDDTNKVLNDYKTSDGTISNNKLNIKFNKIETKEINFTRKAYDNQSSIIYYKGKSQKLAKLRITQNKQTSKIIIKTKGASINIKKLGEVISYKNNKTKIKFIPLEKVKFVLCKNNEYLKEIETDENGEINIDNLYYGDYTLKEHKTNDKYILDNNTYNVNLSLKENSYNIKITNKLKKGNLVINKVDQDNNKKIENTKINIYDNSKNLIYTGYTNENGQIKLNNLIEGVYYIKEIEPNKKYINNNKLFKINIDYKQTKNITITNKKKEIEIIPKTGIDKTNKNYLLIFSIPLLLYALRKR